MSFSEALKFAEGAERARDLAWARKCEEEDRAIEEYNDLCNHLENEFKEFKAKYENQLRYISLEKLHDYLISRYEEKDFDFEPFESLVLDYVEGAKAWEDWEKKNPDYTDEEEKEFDKECDMIRDEMAAILYKNNLMQEKCNGQDARTCKSRKRLETHKNGVKKRNKRIRGFNNF